jgi:hypothetical protein
MYFPDPVILDGPFTSAVYSKSYEMYIKVFDTDTAKAFKAAENICERIRNRRYLIPLINPDGTFAQRLIRIKHAGTRPIESDVQNQGLVQIDIGWDTRYNFVPGRYTDGSTYVPYGDEPKMQEIHIDVEEE